MYMCIGMHMAYVSLGPQQDFGGITLRDADKAKYVTVGSWQDVQNAASKHPGNVGLASAILPCSSFVLYRTRVLLPNGRLAIHWLGPLDWTWMHDTGMHRYLLPDMHSPGES